MCVLVCECAFAPRSAITVPGFWDSAVQNNSIDTAATGEEVHLSVSDSRKSADGYFVFYTLGFAERDNVCTSEQSRGRRKGREKRKEGDGH